MAKLLQPVHKITHHDHAKERKEAIVEEGIFIGGIVIVMLSSTFKIQHGQFNRFEGFEVHVYLDSVCCFVAYFIANASGGGGWLRRLVSTIATAAITAIACNTII